MAADVRKALGVSNSRDALRSLEGDEKDIVVLNTLGRKQEVSIIIRPLHPDLPVAWGVGER